MEITIKKAILHILDTNISTPVFSDKLMELSGESLDYVKGHIERCFFSDNCKKVEFAQDSEFLSLLKQNNDFVFLTREISNNIFNLMLQNMSIPCGDMVFCEASIDGAAHFIFLKLSYKTAYIHYYENTDGENLNYLMKHQTLLPSQGGKIDEAVIINLSDYFIKIIEKKYEIDAVKSFYISNKILQADSSIPERKKLKALTDAATTVIHQSYEELDNFAININNIICEEIVDNSIDINQVEKKIEERFPLAREAFRQEIYNANLSCDQPISVSPAYAKRLEKQSVKTSNGIEVKIPVNVLNSNSSLEFINNPDGTVSLLIKNVIMQ